MGLTPKEMAQHLIQRFGEPCIYISIEPRDIECPINQTEGWTQTAKEIALISIDLILKQTPTLDYHPLGSYTNPMIDYLQQVREEVEKL